MRSCDLGPWTFGRHVDVSGPGRYIDPVDNWYAMWLHFVGKLSGEMGKTNALALLSILNDFAYDCRKYCGIVTVQPKNIHLIVKQLKNVFYLHSESFCRSYISSGFT